MVILRTTLNHKGSSLLLDLLVGGGAWTSACRTIKIKENCTILVYEMLASNPWGGAARIPMDFKINKNHVPKDEQLMKRDKKLRAKKLQSAQQEEKEQRAKEQGPWVAHRYTCSTKKSKKKQKGWS